MPSLLIVEDEDDIRFLLRCMAEQDRWDVVGEAASGEEALEIWAATRPDVIVLDHRMPGLTGLEVAERILAQQPDQAIVMFTAFHDPSLEEAARRAMIRACVPKSDLPRLCSELMACVEDDSRPRD